MSTFTKWNKLPSELRQHSLSYCYTRELGRYAQLSDLCNDEIQNVKLAPKRLTINELKNGNDGIAADYHSDHELCLYFVAASENTHKLVRSANGLVGWNETIENCPTFEGNARHAAFKYVEKLLKYTAQTKIEKLCIDCEKWPYKLERVFKASEWFVHMYPSMYDSFMSFMNAATNVKNVYLYTTSMDQSIMTLPASFFKSNFFKQLEYADFAMKSMISDEDFLNSEAKVLRLKCDTISENAINRKIYKWYETKTGLQLRITLDTKRRFNVNIIQENLPFEDFRLEKIRRPDVVVGIIFIDEIEKVLRFGVN